MMERGSFRAASFLRRGPYALWPPTHEVPSMEADERGTDDGRCAVQNPVHTLGNPVHTLGSGRNLIGWGGFHEDPFVGLGLRSRHELVVREPNQQTEKQ